VQHPRDRRDRPRMEAEPVRCFYCRRELYADGPLGWLHANGARYGEDGHRALPVTPTRR